jgi:hypothetical protein
MFYNMFVKYEWGVLKVKIKIKDIFNNTIEKCVAYPQEDFLFIKLITSFRISLLNNCKKDFQFDIKTTESIFLTLNIRFILHDLFDEVFLTNFLPRYTEFLAK